MTSIFLPPTRAPHQRTGVLTIAHPLLPSQGSCGSEPLAHALSVPADAGFQQEVPVYWRRPHVEAITGLKTATLYRYMKYDLFPRPHKLGPNTVGWSASEVRAWCVNRARA